MPTFEVPVFSTEAARVAVAHGATRLEINRAGSYAAGGLTPTIEEVAAAAAAAAEASVPLRVMIRPRGPPPGDALDFVYTDAELQDMHASLAAFVAADGLLQLSRGDGFVFGVLEELETGRPRLDLARCRALVEAARPFPCILHRAFDALASPESLASARDDCGFAGVLTAGGVGSQGAVAHGGMLRQLVVAEGRQTRQGGFEVIVGGGVRSRNLAALLQEMGLSEETLRDSRRPVAFHASCLLDGAAETVDGDEVARLRALVDSLE